MKIVGLTGGIGSGKTTVAKMFASLGIPVYNSDERAKELMVNSEELVNEIKSLLGEEAYSDNDLNRDYIAQRVFTDKALLNELNELVHPAVRDDFKNWAKEQQSPYVIQEAAILFENGAHEHFDQMVLVTAPKMIRLERIMHRDNVSEDNILARMNHQWEDERKIELSDHIIHNIDLQQTEETVASVHKKILEIDQME